MLELWYQHNKHNNYPVQDVSTSRVAYTKDTVVHFRYLGQKTEPEVGEEELGVVYDLMADIARAVQYVFHYGSDTDAGYGIWLHVRKKLKQIIKLSDGSEIKPIAVIVDGYKEQV